MRKKNAQNSISGLAALLLLGVFAVTVLTVLLSGASAYRRLTERDRMSYDSRTCVQYVATKIRQAPAPDAVRLSSFGQADALVIRESVDGADYLTRVYCYGGWLMELFSEAEGDFAPQDGEKILQAQSLSLTQEGDLLFIALVDGNGTAAELALSLRGGEGAAA